jgi:hypothetical protein
VDYELFELVPMLLLGILGGLLGASFNAASAALITLRHRLLPPSAVYRVAEAVAVALLTSIVSYGVSPHCHLTLRHFAFLPGRHLEAGQKQDWFLKCLQGERAHPLAVCGVT